MIILLQDIQIKTNRHHKYLLGDNSLHGNQRHSHHPHVNIHIHHPQTQTIDGIRQKTSQGQFQFHSHYLLDHHWANKKMIGPVGAWILFI